MSLFVGGLVLIVLGGAMACALRRRRHADAIVQLLVTAGCLTICAAALVVLFSGEGAPLRVHTTVPGGDWIIGIDPLSAVFVLGIGIIGASGAVFGAAYLRPAASHRAVWLVHAVFALEVAALALVVTARAIVPFLGAWEIMAIGSYLLIMFDHEQPNVRRAGLIYLITTHTGTLALFAMFAVWAGHSPDWSFTALRNAASGLPNGGAVVLTLGLFGFGCKAGIVPLHFWLPPAHAAAPTHVSALMSGVVIKTGVYGLLRVLMLLGAPAPAWWGWMVLGIGAASTVLGVMWALAQHDIKGLLAYHSVENIGIIMMGAGVGALGSRYGHPAVALMGYAGALLHTFNHALFKSLLFFGAGAVQRATGTRNIEALGGLARALPHTWLFFLVGATAIIGVPPLNGFVSEWLVYVGLFRAAQSNSALRVASLGVPVLALAGALALACFAKVSGAVFLGRARSPDAAAAQEPGRGFLVPMGVLATACVVLGVVPWLGVSPAMRVAATIVSLPADALADAGVVGQDVARIGAMAAGLVLLIAALGFVRHLVMRGRVARATDTWACAYPIASTRAQYTASSFAAPLVSSFGPLSGVVSRREAGAFATHPTDLVLDLAVAPSWRRILRLALRLRPLQQGRLHMYLIYVMAALLVLLAYLALAA